MVSEPQGTDTGARALADCPDSQSVVQASGRHVGKEVPVARPAQGVRGVCGSVVPRLNDSAAETRIAVERAGWLSGAAEGVGAMGMGEGDVMSEPMSMGVWTYDAASEDRGHVICGRLVGLLLYGTEGLRGALVSGRAIPRPVKPAAMDPCRWPTPVDTRWSCLRVWSALGSREVAMRAFRVCIGA